MTLIKSHRPSPWMLVAVAALAFAMVGTAVAGPSAVSKLTKSKVKSIAKKQADKELKANVSGSHVNTADKAKAADNATNATNATNAQNAAAVNGNAVTRINYKRDSVSGDETIFSGSGLTLTAACAGADNISVVATTSKANSSIYTSVVDTDSNNNNLNADAESGTFQPGGTFNLLAGNDGNPGLITFEYDANDGSSVTGIISVDEDNVDGDDCQAHGHVTAS
jgi:hypothetical protein